MDEGYQTDGFVIEVTAPMELDLLLNPEAILDGNPEFHNALGVKIKVQTPTFSEEDFGVLVRRLDIKEAIQKREIARYGEAVHVETETLQMEKRDPLSVPEPFAAGVNLLDFLNNSIFKKYGLSRWCEIKGLLPSTFPQWSGTSIPDASVFGKGAGIGLCHGTKKLATLHFLAKGTQRWILIPRKRAANIDKLLGIYLKAFECPEEQFECPTFLHHGRFLFDEAFLVDNFDAKAFDMKEGEVLLIQAGVYAQVIATSPGFAISSNCVSRKWLELDPFDGCKDICGDITDADVSKIKMAAIQAKDYTAAQLVIPPPAHEIDIDPPANAMPEVIDISEDNE